ncbi:MAG: hypothetical protein GYA33_03630, partial [Thermogutta sp.]|nr:hypothetical protein [Thermogutta sp.]
MSEKTHRRGFVEKTAWTAASLAAGMGIPAAAATYQDGGDPSAGAATAALPRGKIKNLEVSRLLLGGNLLTHYTHSRDLRYVYSLAREYNTDDKILQTLAVAEANGINTLIIHYVPHAIELLQEHRRRGGKMQWITCTAHAMVSGGLDAFKQQIDSLVAAGTNALYISGIEGDHACGFVNDVSGPEAEQRVGAPRTELLAQALEYAKQSGLPVGIGGHRMGVVEDCEKAGLDNDFYMVTFHHHKYPTAKLNFDSRWCALPEELAALMRNVRKPWIAFKVMAAGAIPPQNAFR